MDFFNTVFILVVVNVCLMFRNMLKCFCLISINDIWLCPYVLLLQNEEERESSIFCLPWCWNVLPVTKWSDCLLSYKTHSRSFKWAYYSSPLSLFIIVSLFTLVCDIGTYTPVLRGPHTTNVQHLLWTSLEQLSLYVRPITAILPVVLWEWIVSSCWNHKTSEWWNKQHPGLTHQLCDQHKSQVSCLFILIDFFVKSRNSVYAVWMHACLSVSVWFCTCTERCKSIGGSCEPLLSKINCLNCVSTPPWLQQEGNSCHQLCNPSS